MPTIHTKRSHLFSSASFIVGLVFVPALFAQALPPSPASAANSAQNGDVVQMQSFTVSGYQQSLDASLSAKRASQSIIDVITAEDLGKFSADTNVAESLSHLPGVTVDRLYGQGEKVSIEGTDPDLNLTFLNGEPVASGVWYTLDQPNRNFNYTLLAPEVVGTAEIYKTSEAWLPEGSLGGTVILHTRQGLDLPANSIAGSVGYNYNDRSKVSKPLGSLVYSWKNNEKTVGIIFSVQQEDDHIRRDGIENYNISSPAQDNAPAVASITPPRLRPFSSCSRPIRTPNTPRKLARITSSRSARASGFRDPSSSSRWTNWKSNLIRFG